MLQYRIKQKVNRPPVHACRKCNRAVYFDAAAAYDSPVLFVVAVIVTYSHKRNLAVLAVLGILSSQHHLFAYIDVTLHVHKRSCEWATLRTAAAVLVPDRMAMLIEGGASAVHHHCNSSVTAQFVHPQFVRDCQHQVSVRFDT